MIPVDHLSPTLKAKLARLDDLLAAHPDPAIAYSGGVDSSFLAWFLVNRGGGRPMAFLVASPFQRAAERALARATAGELRIEFRELAFDPFSVPALPDNPRDRCYLCKRQIMGLIQAHRAEYGCGVVMDGSHADDFSGHRPGRRALEELGILSPLALAGLVKDEIRHLSRLAGLSGWNKPSESCLATRVPYGQSLSPALLARIDAAEQFLIELGHPLVRVRVHAELARIEVDPQSLPRLLDPHLRLQIIDRLQQLGFAHITLDLGGYRSGSWDVAPVFDPGKPEPS